MFMQIEDKPEDVNQGKGITGFQHYSLTPSKDTLQSDEKCFKKYREKIPHKKSSSLPEEYIRLSHRC